MGGKKKNKVEKTPPKVRCSIKFDCDKCGNEKTIIIKFQRDKGYRTALVRCSKCSFKTTLPKIKKIDEPVDVYIKWKQNVYEEKEESDDDEKVDIL